MEKVRPWCDQPSARGQLKNKTKQNRTDMPVYLRADLRKQMCKLYQISGDSYLWSLLGFPLKALQYVTHFRFSRWRHMFT